MGGSCLLKLICQSISSHFSIILCTAFIQKEKKHFYFVWPLSEKNCGTFEIGGKNITSVFYKWIKQCNVCDFTDQWAELLYSGSFEESRILNPLSRIPESKIPEYQNPEPGSRIQDPGFQNTRIPESRLFRPFSSCNLHINSILTHLSIIII